MTESDNSSPDPSPVAQILGSILMVIGAMVMAASGLCTIVFGGGALMNFDGAVIGLALVFGGIPFASGYAAFRLGKYLRRE